MTLRKQSRNTYRSTRVTNCPGLLSTKGFAKTWDFRVNTLTVTAKPRQLVSVRPEVEFMISK